MSNPHRAVAVFKSGFCCSQAIFSSYAENLGLDKDQALKISDAFCAGMGGRAETCGAVTGAMMVIGLKYGRTDHTDKASREKTHSLVQEFVKEFTALHKHTQCKHLLGHDISTPDGSAAAREADVFNNLCPNFIHDTAGILDRLL